mmetsp:Transcript_29111/g.43877  ORF Transcript_29111/g.43877 Transcript_29111/m.43877 type:complete len:94 (-) Transcript_29111:992-1273(-)
MYDEGPNHPDCISLSHMCSVAVDFAKHGECVSRKNFADLTKLITRFPDFLEKKGQIRFESQKVLGQLYRGIKSSNALDQLVENDWNMAVCLKY